MDNRKNFVKARINNDYKKSNTEKVKIGQNWGTWSLELSQEYWFKRLKYSFFKE